MPNWPHSWAELQEFEKYLREEETPQYMSALTCKTTVHSHKPQLCASWKLPLIPGKTGSDSAEKGNLSQDRPWRKQQSQRITTFCTEMESEWVGNGYSGEGAKVRGTPLSLHLFPMRWLSDPV